MFTRLACADKFPRPTVYNKTLHRNRPAASPKTYKMHRISQAQYRPSKAAALATIATLLCLIPAIALALSERQRALIAERLAPPAVVCMQGQSCAAAVLPAVAGEPRSGEKIYQSACVSCHAMGVAGAPMLGDPVWEERLVAGVEALYRTSIDGKGGMPPRGACPNCSDEELRRAVDYILAQIGQ